MTLVRHTCPLAALTAAKKRRSSNADPSEQLQQEELKEEEEVDCRQPQMKKHKQSIP